MSTLQINGNSLPEPSSLTIGYSDLDSDSSKRNEAGVLQRDRIRGSIHKISCKWTAITNAQAEIILQAIQAPSFILTFFDPFIGGNSSIKAYASERSGDSVATHTGGRWNLGFDILEY